MQSGGLRLNRTIDFCTAATSSASPGFCPTGSFSVGGMSVYYRSSSSVTPTEDSAECAGKLVQAVGQCCLHW